MTQNDCSPNPSMARRPLDSSERTTDAREVGARMGGIPSVVFDGSRPGVPAMPLTIRSSLPRTPVGAPVEHRLIAPVSRQPVEVPRVIAAGERAHFLAQVVRQTDVAVRSQDHADDLGLLGPA